MQNVEIMIDPAEILDCVDITDAIDYYEIDDVLEDIGAKRTMDYFGTEILDMFDVEDVIKHFEIEVAE